MYVVIFKAELAELDDEYFSTAAALRKRAVEEFGCVGFQSLTEGASEVTLSYWRDQESIARWSKDPEHLGAQRTGARRWYKRYSVEVAHVVATKGTGHAFNQLS